MKMDPKTTEARLSRNNEAIRTASPFFSTCELPINAFQCLCMIDFNTPPQYRLRALYLMDSNKTSLFSLLNREEADEGTDGWMDGWKWYGMDLDQGVLLLCFFLTFGFELVFVICCLWLLLVAPLLDGKHN
jgi:hypothetical protein